MRVRIRGEAVGITGQFALEVTNGSEEVQITGECEQR